MASPYRNVLTDKENNGFKQVTELIDSLKGDPQAKFCVTNLDGVEDKLARVVDYADEKYKTAVSISADREDSDDLKIKIDRQMLIDLIGLDLCAKLESMFGHYSDIIIRRCQSHGKLIDFHLDSSTRTLQLVLNDDKDYVGGRLVFATEGQLHVPVRSKGTVTIHDNTIVHGVTQLESGVRYGLFFLDK